MSLLEKMKKIKGALLLALLFSFACNTDSYLKIKIETPTRTVFDLSQYKNLVITDFLIKQGTKDIDLNKEIIDYLSTEIGLNFKGNVSSEKVPLEKEEVFKTEEFWKNLSVNLKEALFLSGSVQYTEEVRKAVLEQKKSRFEEPFSREKGLTERKFYTLNLELYLIDTVTGKILYTRKFKESNSYKNPKQTSYFAFFDLIQNVKGKLFNDVLGKGKIQERYLVSE